MDLIMKFPLQFLRSTGEDSLVPRLRLAPQYLTTYVSAVEYIAINGCMEAIYHLERPCTFPPWEGLDGFRTILWHDI